MADIQPFRPWRYTAKAGPLGSVATQPYDTIPPALEAMYRESSEYNLVSLILPGKDYAGAASRMRQWVNNGILARDPRPALYVYEQRFRLPETSEALVRRGVIGLGATEGVHPHERTLDGPRVDRLELLRHTRAQFGCIFMMYPDAEGCVERLMDEVQGAPLAEFTDHQDTAHSLWRVEDQAWIAAVQEALRDKPLVIVDGHHRYAAALEHGSARVMMMFVRMEAKGLRTLAAHRVVSGVTADLRSAWAGLEARPTAFQFEVVTAEERRIIGVERREGELNLTALHERVLGERLGITAADITAQRFVQYRRGRETAIAEVESGRAQIAFLVEPLEVAEVARLALSGVTLPQKSTDFYPKLASGLTIYRLDD